MSVPQNVVALLSLPVYISNIMVSSTQTLAQIKSQKFIGHKNQQFMTKWSLVYVTNYTLDFVKCCFKTWVHLDLWPNKILFGRLQPKRAKVICLMLTVNSLLTSGISSMMGGCPGNSFSASSTSRTISLFYK